MYRLNVLLTTKSNGKYLTLLRLFFFSLIFTCSWRYVFSLSRVSARNLSMPGHFLNKSSSMTTRADASAVGSDPFLSNETIFCSSYWILCFFFSMYLPSLSRSSPRNGCPLDINPSTNLVNATSPLSMILVINFLFLSIRVGKAYLKNNSLFLFQNQKNKKESFSFFFAYFNIFKNKVRHRFFLLQPLYELISKNQITF